MKTTLLDQVQQTPWGKQADHILRSCVHCGFCTANCPTYRLLGNELDSPRGRIYLIKALLEGQAVSPVTQTHLDRCLQCRACETTCPSGVNYHELLEIGQQLITAQLKRPLSDRLLRKILQLTLPYPLYFQLLVGLGRLAHPLLPTGLKLHLPPPSPKTTWPPLQSHIRKMVVLPGCVQSVLTPQVNVAAARVLNELGIELLPGTQQCCGALSYHLGEVNTGLEQARRFIDQHWPWIEQGVETIVSTASGCGAFIKEYGRLFKTTLIPKSQQPPWLNKDYAEKAAHFAHLTRDIAEVVATEIAHAQPPQRWSALPSQRIALHIPCTLQHGQRLTGHLEGLLTRLNFSLLPVTDSQICCGAGGSYSLLQPQLSEQLAQQKLQVLQANSPDLIVTANIGCYLHLQNRTSVPVKHWIELLAGD